MMLHGLRLDYMLRLSGSEILFGEHNGIGKGWFALQSGNETRSGRSVYPDSTMTFLGAGTTNSVVPYMTGVYMTLLKSRVLNPTVG